MTMQKFIRFLKDWTLAISIVMGMLAYFAFAACPLFDGVRPYAEPTVAIVQPTLLFLMLFFTFCKISVRDLRLRRWHGVLLATQLLCFAATAAATPVMPPPTTIRSHSLFVIEEISIIVHVLPQFIIISRPRPFRTRAARRVRLHYSIAAAV